MGVAPFALFFLLTLPRAQARFADLKAKNQIDLLDFKIDVVGDDPDDWDEIREMRSTIDA